jgi:hypothetical protein
MARKKNGGNKPETAEAPRPRVVSFLRSLRVQLRPEEIATRADRAAHKLGDVQAKKEELKASTKHQKAVIEALEAEVNELSGEVRTRSTYRMVECQQIFDYTTSRVREVRRDTDEVLDERRMTEAECQRELPFAEANGEAPSAADVEAESDGLDVAQEDAF